MSKEAMKLALEALEWNMDYLPSHGHGTAMATNAITALREALAEQTAQQKPVAWRTFDGEGGYEYRSYEMNEQYAQEWEQRNPKHKGWVEPLYTSPQAQRTWVGLTDEQIEALAKQHFAKDERSFKSCARAIEAKLKEKNA